VGSFQVVACLLPVLTLGAAVDAAHVGIDGPLPVLGQLVAVRRLLEQFLRIVHPVLLRHRQILKETTYH
jgi:hypothetical protein